MAGKHVVKPGGLLPNLEGCSLATQFLNQSADDHGSDVKRNDSFEVFGFIHVKRENRRKQEIMVTEAQQGGREQEQTETLDDKPRDRNQNEEKDTYGKVANKRFEKSTHEQNCDQARYERLNLNPAEALCFWRVGPTRDRHACGASRGEDAKKLRDQLDPSDTVKVLTGLDLKVDRDQHLKVSVSVQQGSSLPNWGRC